MQQRRDRRGGDHRDGQPAMQRHERRLDPERHDQDDEQRPRGPGPVGRDLLHHAAGDEIRGARKPPKPQRPEKQQQPARQRVDQIDAPGPQRGRRAIMDHQRIGRDGQQLVEQQEGEEVARHGNADRRRDAKAEEAEKARPVGTLLQISDRVDGGHQPEHGRQRDEHQCQRVGLKMQVEPRQHGQAHIVDHALRRLPREQDHQHHLDRGDGQVQRGAQPRSALGQREEHRRGAQRGQKDDERQQRHVDHGVTPKGCPNSRMTRIGAAARPSPMARTASAKGGASASAHPRCSVTGARTRSKRKKPVSAREK